jgi:hypothetical protein
MSILIAVESIGPDLFRWFYVSADSQLHAESLLRGAFPDVGEIQWHAMSENFGRAVHLRPNEVMECQIGRRVVVESLSEPSGNDDKD